MDWRDIEHEKNLRRVLVLEYTWAIVISFSCRLVLLAAARLCPLPPRRNKLIKFNTIGTETVKRKLAVIEGRLDVIDPDCVLPASHHKSRNSLPMIG